MAKVKAIPDGMHTLPPQLTIAGAAHPSSVWIYSNDVDGAFQRATAAGAEAAMPLSDMFWGDRMGQVKDRWGNRWVLAQHVRELSAAEVKKAQEAFAAKSRR